MTIVYLFYETGFIDNHRGYAAAIAFVLLVIILIAHRHPVPPPDADGFTMSTESTLTREPARSNEPAAAVRDTVTARTKRGPRQPWLVHTLLIAGAVVMIFPFVWELLTSFKTFDEAHAVPPQIIPSPWDFGNFAKVFATLPFAVDADQLRAAHDRPGPRAGGAVHHGRLRVRTAPRSPGATCSSRCSCRC